MSLNILYFVLPIVFSGFYVNTICNTVVESKVVVSNNYNLQQELQPKLPPDSIVVLKVEATAYNSLVSQTDSNPTIAAWGDKLKPGMKCIAVSRDLLEMGLTHNTEVTIEGLDGVYLVKDKMAARWTKRIDIYMGVDSHKAFKWGVRNVKIKWKVKK